MAFWNIFGRNIAKPTATYDAARARRRMSGWAPSTASQRAMLANDGGMMRARSRDVVRNNPYAAAACDSFVTNLIGAGIKPSSQHEDETVRQQIMDAWLAWTDESDADGLTDFYGMQAIVARALFDSGEVFVRFRPRKLDDLESTPLQIQLLESDMLDFSFSQQAANGNDIINGVEFDLRGQRVAYHFWSRHPGDGLLAGRIGGNQRVRVPATEVLHVMKPVRPGGVRGAPLVSPAVVRLWLLDQYDDAELDRKKTAAMYAGFIRSPSPEDLMDEVVNDTGVGGGAPAEDGVVTLEPGTMQTLLPGEEVTFSSPSEVGGSYEAFQYRNLLAVFAAMGVPYTLGTGDLKRANYSSLRGAIIEYRRRLEQMQHGIMVFQFCRPVWRRWLDAAVLAGVVTIPKYAAAPSLAAKAKWIPPKFEWVDPYKDRNAELLAVKAGFKSRSDVIEAEGEDPIETDRKIAADRAREKELGLVFDSNPAAPAEIAAMTAASDSADQNNDSAADGAQAA